MKKQYKWIALFLSICMFSAVLFACGDAKTGFYKTVKQLNEIRTFDFEISGDVSITDETVALRVSGHVEDSEHMKVTAEMKMPQAEDYTPLTDLYIIGTDGYINVGSLMSAFMPVEAEDGDDWGIPEMPEEGEWEEVPEVPEEGEWEEIPEMPEEGEWEEVPEMPIDPESYPEMPDFSAMGDAYYKISLSDLMKEQTGAEAAENEAYVSLFRDLFATCIDFVEKAAKDVKPEVVTKDGNKYTFSISEKNVQAFVTNFGKVLESDLNPALEQLIADYREKGGDYAAVADDLENILKDDAALKESVDGIKSYTYDSDEAFSAAVSVEMNGSAGSRVFASQIKAEIPAETDTEGETVKLALSVTIRETKEPVTITAPENVISEEMGDMFGSMFLPFAGDVSSEDDYPLWNESDFWNEDDAQDNVIDFSEDTDETDDND